MKVRVALEQLLVGMRNRLRSGIPLVLLWGMVELIFENPYHITAKIVAQELSVSSPTVYHYLTTLVEDGILQQRSDRQKRRVYAAEAVKRIIEAPLSEVAI